MFTANSMNCLAEAIGLALPGNGTLLATHARRWELFEDAGRRIVSLARRYYIEGDESVLPRSIATFEAFENAMTLDIAMGGSTNTILHLLAAAEEAGVDFKMHHIDALSRRVPNLAKVAPSSSFHIEDVNRAGGIFTILGALDRGGLVHREVATVHTPHPGRGHRRRGRATPHGQAGGAGPRAGRTRRHPHHRRVLPGHLLRFPGRGRRPGLHPGDRARLQPRRRARHALRQHRPATAAW